MYKPIFFYHSNDFFLVVVVGGMFMVIYSTSTFDGIFSIWPPALQTVCYIFINLCACLCTFCKSLKVFCNLSANVWSLVENGTFMSKALQKKFWKVYQ